MPQKLSTVVGPPRCFFRSLENNTVQASGLKIWGFTLWRGRRFQYCHPEAG